MKILTPAGWTPGKGYSHGISSRGRIVFVAGQLGTDSQGKIVGESFAAQVKQALANVMAVLAADGAEAKHITKMNWFFTTKDEYVAERKAIGAAWKELLGDHYPAITAVQVSGLLIPGGKIEIEAVAVVPE